jgi:pyruvate,water dikinase
MTAIVRAFHELAPQEAHRAGAKGATLARLLQRGFPVPDGLLLMPCAFAEDRLSAGAWSEIKTRLARLRRRDPQTRFAVRSSALAEDSPRASFAGEFETVLDLSTDDEIRAAIEVVRQSRHSDRVRAYSQAQGLDADDEMAIIVQELVRADLSGILFTADPITGRRDRMVGNLVHGLGNSLVAGETQGIEFTLKLPKGRYDGPAELEPFARTLFRLARRLERELGCPQDIEWALADGKISLIQSRPITTLRGFDPITGEFNDALTGDYTWSCVNVGEAVSVVMTPFTWSLLKRAYAEIDIARGYSSIGNIGGRPYQNVTVMASAFAALGRDFADLSGELGGVRAEYVAKMEHYLVPLPEIKPLTVLPRAIRMIVKQQLAMRGLDKFVGRNPQWCRTMCNRIGSLQTTSELAAAMDDALLPRTLDSFWRLLATTFRHGELVSKARRELSELVSPEDADVLLSNVSRQGDILASMGPLVGLARVAHGQLTREAYLEQWGHRGPEETEAYVPRPFEDADWLDRQLDAFTRSSVDVDALLAAQRTSANPLQIFGIMV